MKKSYKKHHSGLNFSSQLGVTLMELIVVIGILMLLLSISFVGISNLRASTTNSNFGAVIISDLKSQQIKAVAGDTEGRSTSDNYGIKILSDKYVLFHGNSYNASEPTNVEIPASSGFTLTSSFANNTILFERGSGEIRMFVNGQNTITITNAQTGQVRVIQLNKYGSVISFN